MGCGMRVSLILSFLATFLSSASQSVYAFDKEKLFQAYFTIVMIHGYDEKGGLGSGSGVVVGPNKVLTNCHVFRTTSRPWIARGEDTYAINSVKADTWHDLCLVSTDPLPLKSATIGQTLNLKRRQEVVGFGHSNGVPAPLTSNGVVQGLYDDAPGKVIRTSAKFLMGASGSGLFDLDGNLIGINTFKTAGKWGSVHFALPIEWLDKLDKQTENSTFPISGKALWEEDEDKKPFYMQAAVPESRADWPKLVQVAEKWTAQEPKSSEAWFALGLGQENNGKADLAEQAYKKAIEMASDNFEAMLKLGALAKARGDQAEMHRIQLVLNDADKDVATEFADTLGCDKAC